MLRGGDDGGGGGEEAEIKVTVAVSKRGTATPNKPTSSLALHWSSPNKHLYCIVSSHCLIIKTAGGYGRLVSTNQKGESNTEQKYGLTATTSCDFASTEFLAWTRARTGGLDEESLRNIDQKLEETLHKPHSDSEQSGFLYVYRISDPFIPCHEDAALYKVGRTVDFPRRREQWDTQCPSQGHFWFEPIEVEYSHRTGERDGFSYAGFTDDPDNRTERLVHLALHKICLSRPREECHDCGRKHMEIFELEEIDGVETMFGVIVPIVAEMRTRAAACPRK
ncbi:hypothetical protein PM082_012141 [Marasmius tenuissimus]|nr:hypothetical protein PM082_012141 [Marasmius tenuissimus]